MAQLLGIVGKSHEQRREYAGRAAPGLSLVSGLTCGSQDIGDATLAWALHPSVPFSLTAEDEGKGGAIVLGRLGSERQVVETHAASLLRIREEQGKAAISGCGGYYAACLVEPSGEVILGTDRLGLFPLYYHATDQYLLFSTTPSAIIAHPDFRRELSVPGLVGNLLTMHMVGGQTLWNGIRRLRPGHALVWQRGTGAKLLEGKALKASERYFDQSLAEHVQRFDMLMEQEITREAEGQAAGLMLSGGLDSRLVAGYLHQAVGEKVTAVTMGEETDLEMRIAARVARCLGWARRSVRADWSSFAHWAEVHIRAQHLATGFNDLSSWYAVEALQALQRPVFTGLLGDAVMGGSHILWGYDAGRQTYTFEALFRKVNRFGYSPATIQRLVRPELLGDSLDEVLDDLCATLQSYHGLPFQRALAFDLQHRQRFHVGGLAWILAFGSRPVLPFTAIEILESATAMPATTLLGRRAQIELLCRRFPVLAALPLDRNDYDTRPLRPPTRLHRLFYRTAGPVLGRLERARAERTKQERRYYYRVFDINNPGWVAVRHEAEKHRRKMTEVFDPEALAELLPPPDVHIPLPDGIIDAAKMKTLLGLMLWMGKYL